MKYYVTNGLPMPDDYTVRLVDMPESQGGIISESPDGHINVYINARLSQTGQHNAARHEWEHWLRDDLHSGKDIREIEAEKPLPKVFKARDLIPKPKYDMDKYAGWKDDVIHTLPTYDAYNPEG